MLPFSSNEKTKRWKRKATHLDHSFHVKTKKLLFTALQQSNSNTEDHLHTLNNDIPYWEYKHDIDCRLNFLHQLHHFLHQLHQFLQLHCNRTYLHKKTVHDTKNKRKRQSSCKQGEEPWWRIHGATQALCTEMARQSGKVFLDEKKREPRINNSPYKQVKFNKNMSFR